MAEILGDDLEATRASGGQATSSEGSVLARSDDLAGISGQVVARVETVSKTPPPIDLSPSLALLAQLPVLSGDKVRIAQIQLRSSLRTRFALNKLGHVLNAANELLRYINGALYVLGQLHTVSKEGSFEGEVPDRSPRSFPGSSPHLLGKVPVLTPLVTHLPTSLNLNELMTDWQAVGDQRLDRAVRERFFYDLKKMKSILASYLNGVAVLRKNLRETRDSMNAKKCFRGQSRRQGVTPRMNPSGISRRPLDPVRARAEVTTPRTPLQILGKRYRLDKGEMGFYQKLADAGDEGVCIDPNKGGDDVARQARLCQDLMRKLPRSYFCFLPEQHVALSPLGLRQLLPASSVESLVAESQSE